MTIQISREKISQICFIIPAILTTLAITQGDSTLAPSWIVGMVSAINWLCFAVLLFLLPNKKITSSCSFIGNGYLVPFK